MSTEEGEAGPACGEARGGTTVTRRHTWEEGEPHGSQGRLHPDDEDEGEGEEEGECCREGRSSGDACIGGHTEKFNVENNGGNFSNEDGAVGGASCKTQAMHSNCSSETCIPTPSCRICFQGAEQVNVPTACKWNLQQASHVSVHDYVSVLLSD